MSLAERDSVRVGDVQKSAGVPCVGTLAVFFIPPFLEYPAPLGAGMNGSGNSSCWGIMPGKERDLSHAGEDGLAVFAADVGRNDVGVQVRDRGARMRCVAETDIKCAAADSQLFYVLLRDL